MEVFVFKEFSYLNELEQMLKSNNIEYKINISDKFINDGFYPIYVNNVKIFPKIDTSKLNLMNFIESPIPYKYSSMTIPNEELYLHKYESSKVVNEKHTRIFIRDIPDNTKTVLMHKHYCNRQNLLLFLKEKYAKEPLYK